jgi:hypothetical protein
MCNRNIFGRLPMSFRLHIWTIFRSSFNFAQFNIISLASKNMASSSNSSAAFPVTSTSSYAPGAVSPKGYLPSFQVGRKSRPAQILYCEAGVYDQNKSTISGKVLIIDPESVLSIRSLEEKQAHDHPSLALNSCLESVINPDTGDEGWALRVKFTRNPRCYRSNNPWQTGAAPTLDLLAYGHTVLMQCREQGWCYQESCGITVYANLIRGVGAVAEPWGLGERAPEVQWQ